MAGNTKLVGFLDNHRIQLERWGVVTNVTLDQTSVEAIRAACFNELPKKPNTRPTAHLDEFMCRYDQEMGRVQLNLSPEATACLADLLEQAPRNATLEKVTLWLERLRAATQAHVDFHNGKDEPGVP